jgi:rhomboid protease GluP
MMDLMDPRRMCPHCRAFITIKDRVCPYCKESLEPKRSGDDSAGVWGFIPHVRFNTMIILLINFGLYMATALFSMNSGNEQAFLNLDGRTLLAFGAKYGPSMARYGEWWRLVTAGFLHGGIIHILMNSWVLFDLGAQVEEFYGASRMLVIYFAGTVVGFYGSYLWSPTLSVGASAGICGLIGAMIAFNVHSQSGMGLAIRSMYIRWALYVLVFGLLTSYTDNAAHIGGLVGGYCVAYVAGLPGPVRSAKEMLWRVAAGLCILITALCFLTMYLWFSRNTR